MYVCMYVYMHVCIDICMHAHASSRQDMKKMHARTHNACMHVYSIVWKCLHAQVENYTNTCRRMHMHTCVHTSVHASSCMCMAAAASTKKICMHAYTYMHTNIHTGPRMFWGPPQRHFCLYCSLFSIQNEYKI